MDCPIQNRASRRRSRNITRVLDVAEAMFAETSYASVGIEKIADSADVSVGTIYNYFDGKQGVYVAVAERVLDRVEQAIEPAFDLQLDPSAGVAMLGELYLQALIDNPIACQSLVSSDLTPGDNISQAVQDRVAQLYSAVAELIERGVTEERFVPVDSNKASRFIIGAWNGVFASTFQTHAPKASIEDVAQTLQTGTEILWRGLKNNEGEIDSP